MSVQIFPSGISVVQAKKDAKKLAKSTGLQLSEAQNVIAFKHGRASWPVLVGQRSTQSSLSLSFNQGKQKLNFPEHRSFTIVEGSPCSGKSILLIEAAAQMIQAGCPVVYLSCGLSTVYSWDLAGQAIVEQQKRNTNLFRVHDFLDEHLDLASFELNGAILIVDEINAFFNKYPFDLIDDLFKASKHTILACQSQTYIERYLANNNISNDIIQMLFFNNRQAASFGIKLENKRGRSVEFLAVKENSTQKLSLNVN